MFKYPVVDKNNEIIGYVCAENEHSPVYVNINDNVSLIKNADYKILLPKQDKKHQRPYVILYSHKTATMSGEYGGMGIWRD